ncbi:hypothetical protein BTUL_0026g00710 [Botrytis tulipae]|uniref:Uncharacterized protein n=1 Tax=Botrytis tulipae TaxID=87230 RepID=A0A4Z1F5Y8_9HELO|nr:hypothetical protein BTUL_0026g00710 [Botrytis tulipae]
MASRGSSMSLPSTKKTMVDSSINDERDLEAVVKEVWTILEILDYRFRVLTPSIEILECKEMNIIQYNRNCEGLSSM